MEINFISLSREIYRKYLKNKKNRILSLVLVIVVGVIINSTGPYVFGKIIDAITEMDLETFMNYLFIYVLVNVSSMLFGIFESVFAQTLIIDSRNEIKSSMFRKILLIKMNRLDKYEKGELIGRLEGDSGEIIGFFISVISNIVLIIINLVVALYFMFKISKSLALFSIAFIPIVFTINEIFKKYKVLIEVRNKEMFDKYTSFTNFSIFTVDGSRAFRMEEYLLDKYERLNNNLKSISIESLKNHQISEVLKDIVATIFSVTLLYKAVEYIFKGLITLGGLISFSSYTIKLFDAVNNIMNLNMDSAGVSVSMNRLDGLLSEPNEENLSSTQIELDKINKLNFSNVSFSYGGNNIFSNINLEIKTQGLYTIVGINGSGKSTLFKILMNYYDIDDGVVRINDRNIQIFSNKSIRKEILYLSKNNYIMNESIIKNIRIVSPNASQIDIHAACSKVGLHDIILQLEEGYNTLLGEKGISFSSGEEQKLMLVRAMLSEASVILLDEITSDLDGHAEKKVVDILCELAKHKIVIQISHRINSIRVSDKIIVIDNKKICGIGTHAELISNLDIYKRLFKNDYKY